jgi:hypothetical protein
MPWVAAGRLARAGVPFPLVVAATILVGVAGLQVVSAPVPVPGASAQLGLLPPATLAPIPVWPGPVPPVLVAAGLDPPAAVRARAAVVTAGPVPALIAAGPPGAARPAVGVRRPGIARTRG